MNLTVQLNYRFLTQSLRKTSFRGNSLGLWTKRGSIFMFHFVHIVRFHSKDLREGTLGVSLHYYINQNRLFQPQKLIPSSQQHPGLKCDNEIKVFLCLVAKVINRLICFHLCSVSWFLLSYCGEKVIYYSSYQSKKYKYLPQKETQSQKYKLQ